MTYYDYKTDNVLDIDKRLTDTKYRVEASRYEQMVFSNKYDLEDDNIGLFLTVAHSHMEPLTITIYFSYWMGQRFMYWSPESNTIKYDLIEESSFIKTYLIYLNIIKQMLITLTTALKS